MPVVPSALLRVHRGIAAACGALFGASVFAFGFYDPSHWGPLALAVLAVCLALIASLRACPSVSALTAIAGLAGLWLWSLLSRGWSPSPATALVDANRWALYAAMLAALVALVGADRLTARILVGACAAAVLAIAGYVLVRMLAGTAGSLFLGVRLNGPIGYVNAQADFLALGVWPLLAVAERTARPLRAGLALGTATTLGALVFVAQSRGSLLAFAASAIAIVALVPGRRARLLALALVLAGLYVASGRLAGVYRHPSPATGLVTVSALRSAAVAALLAGVACGAAWAGAGLARRALARVPLAGRDAGTVAATALLAVLLAGGLAAVAARQSSIRHDISDQYDAFVHLGASPGGAQSRLFSGGGNRYDYWRIAWKEFESQPLRGVGAGGYDVGYYRDRRTNEDIRQPHSVELQTLAELGLVGGLALLAFVGAGLAGIWRCRRADRLLAVAAGGTFCVWLAHSSLDWIELLPGLHRDRAQLRRRAHRLAGRDRGRRAGDSRRSRGDRGDRGDRARDAATEPGHAAHRRVGAPRRRGRRRRRRRAVHRADDLRPPRPIPGAVPGRDRPARGDRAHQRRARVRGRRPADLLRARRRARAAEPVRRGPHRAPARARRRARQLGHLGAARRPRRASRRPRARPPLLRPGAPPGPARRRARQPPVTPQRAGRKDSGRGPGTRI